MRLLFTLSISKPTIGRVWQDGQNYYSIVDILCELLDLNPKAARNYYLSLKKKLVKQPALSPIKLKVPANDGKSYLTDVVSLHQLLEITLYISSPRIDDIRASFANIIKEQFSQKGIESQIIFWEALSDAVLDAPATIFVEATEKVYKGLWQRTTAQLRGELKISKKENPRDHFGKYALIYTRLAEELATEKLGAAETVSMPVAMEIVWEVAKMIGRQAKEVSESLGYDLVTEKPLLSKAKPKN